MCLSLQAHGATATKICAVRLYFQVYFVAIALSEEAPEGLILHRPTFIETKILSMARSRADAAIGFGTVLPAAEASGPRPGE
jgi:hypothetical protein